MKLSAAILAGIATACLLALILSFFPTGLTPWKALCTMFCGIGIGIMTFRETIPFSFNQNLSKPPSHSPLRTQFWDIALWIVFILASLRSFLWLIFAIGDEWKIQSPNNLGDLAMHIQFIEYLASGIRFWPESPLFYEGPFRYPFGIDLFNALQIAIGLPLFPILKWTGLIGSLLTAYTLWRWGGAFTMAAFLFAGGLTGFTAFQTLQIEDYQSAVAWKNLFLALFVTQRGLLWALPAGLLLLIDWRNILLTNAESGLSRRRVRRNLIRSRNLNDGAASNAEVNNLSSCLLPFWVQLLLYASMPLFHMHTFLALSLVLAIAWAGCSLNHSISHLKSCLERRKSARCGPSDISQQQSLGQDRLRILPLRSCLGYDQNPLRRLFFLFFKQAFRATFLKNTPQYHFLRLACSAFIPATVLLYLVTGGFSASSFLTWSPGWMSDGNELHFWLINFGLSLPLAVTACIIISFQYLTSLHISMPLCGIVCRLIRVSLGEGGSPFHRISFLPLPFVTSAALLFLLTVTFHFARWEWDNVKLLVWSWLIIAPYVWDIVIRPLTLPLRYALCFGLFFSGAISLLGGLGSSHSYSLISRKELAMAYNVTKDIPSQARFAIEPSYNNPLILLGRKVVMGYPGHVWSHGYNYRPIETLLNQALFKADPLDSTWKQLNADYLFLGNRNWKVQTKENSIAREK